MDDKKEYVVQDNMKKSLACTPTASRVNQNSEKFQLEFTQLTQSIENKKDVLLLKPINDRLKKDKAALARIDAHQKTAEDIRIGPDRSSAENKKDS